MGGSDGGFRELPSCEFQRADGFDVVGIADEELPT
jgi:hypothetical protein